LIYSMTGFGKGSAEGESFGVEVEINSVNSRYLDIKFKLPNYLYSAEHQLRKLVANKVDRGKLNITINISIFTPDFKPIGIDIEAAEKFYEELTLLNNRLGLNQDIDISLLLSAPDIIKNNYSDKNLESIIPEVKKALDEALDNLAQNRNREGEFLSADIKERLGLVISNVDAINKLAPANSEKLLKKIREKLIAVLGDIEMDETRLMLEAGVLAERYDITEELVRLRSHIDNFLSDLNRGGTIGKRLNFILQEMGREINTVGAKCNDASISALVVNIKEELEKIREQAANLQ